MAYPAVKAKGYKVEPPPPSKAKVLKKPSTVAKPLKIFVRSSSVISRVGSTRPLVARPTITREAVERWIWPVRSTRITQGPGARHLAFDIGGTLGDPVFAPIGSTVAAVRWQPEGYGLNIRLLSPTGEEIILGHLQAVAPGISEGIAVQQGQQVGLLGSTGRSTGPHLHYEIRAPGPDVFGSGFSSTTTAIDPRRFYPSDPILPGTAGRLGSLDSFQFAPMANIPGVDVQEALALAGQIAVQGLPAPFNFIQQAAAQAAPQKVAAKDEAPRGDVRLATTPVGDITVPRPDWVKWLGLAIGAIIVLISLAVLVWPHREALTPPWQRPRVVARVAKAGIRIAARRAGVPAV